MVNRQRDLLRIRVELVGILPPIWRELLVPARYSFWDLHVAIQDAMGWWDCHLHQFIVDDRQQDDSTRIGIPDEEWQEPESTPVLPGWETPVAERLWSPGQQIEYEYDFGDSWIHQLTLLGIEPRVKGQRYPQCVAGERACPPEDCGGVSGYLSLLEALFDPEHEEHQELTAWIPRGWGPELFKPQNVRFDNPNRRWNRVFLDGR